MRSRKLILYLFVLFISLVSCRKGVEVGRIPLSNEERNFIPYQIGQQIRLKHSTGYEFDLKVIQKNFHWTQTERHHAGDNYFSYEMLDVVLTSAEPDFVIVLNIKPNWIYRGMELNINRHGFQLLDIAQPSWLQYTINSTAFNNVFALAGYNANSPIIIPDSVYYNSTFGILKISMTNDEAYNLIH